MLVDTEVWETAVTSDTVPLSTGPSSAFKKGISLTRIAWTQQAEPKWGSVLRATKCILSGAARRRITCFDLEKGIRKTALQVGLIRIRCSVVAQFEPDGFESGISLESFFVSRRSAWAKERAAPFSHRANCAQPEGLGYKQEGLRVERRSPKPLPLCCELPSESVTRRRVVRPKLHGSGYTRMRLLSAPNSIPLPK